MKTVANLFLLVAKIPVIILFCLFFVSLTFALLIFLLSLVVLAVPVILTGGLAYLNFWLLTRLKVINPTF